MEEKIKLYDKKIHLMRELENLLGIEKMGVVFELLKVQEELDNYVEIEVLD